MSKNTDLRRIVPWNSMTEWRRVKTLVFSHLLEDKKEALNHVIMWKSRVSKLCVGIECTLYLLQAIIRDEDMKNNPEGILLESDVKLLYSTAIIRFVNLTSHLGQVDQRHQPISAIARKAGIPDWLVGIRHEATHSTMPSLGILRPGSKLAFDWLENNYWHIEEEKSFPLHWPESKKGSAKLLRSTKKPAEEASETILEIVPLININKDLQFAVDMLVVLLKEITLVQILDHIKSEPLRRYGFELWENTITKTVSEKEAKHLKLPLNRIKHLLVSEIERLASVAEKKASTKGSCIVTALLNTPEFPTEDGRKFTDFFPVWKLVQRTAGLPYLFIKMVDKVVENDARSSLYMALIADLGQELLNARNNPGKSLKSLDVDKSSTAHDLSAAIELLMKEPKIESWNAISKLCALQNLDQAAIDDLHNLCVLYLSMPVEKDSCPATGKIYSVETFVKSPKKAKIEEKPPTSNNNKGNVAAETVDAVEVVDHWILCTDEDWNRVLIGTLPNKQHIEELEHLVADWNYIPAESETRSPDLGVPHKKRTGDRMDWNSLPRKRKKRGGLPRDTTVI